MQYVQALSQVKENKFMTIYDPNLIKIYKDLPTQII